jgi:hypothetical protein
VNSLLHTSLLNITVVTFKVLPLGSYALMPAPSPPFETILELAFRAAPDVINVIKIPPFQIFPLSSGTEKVIEG